MVGSSLVDTRSVFSETAKWKILIFRFCRYRGFRVKPQRSHWIFSNGKVRPLGIVFKVVSRNEEVHSFVATQMKTPSNGAYEINTRYTWAHKRICGIQV